MREVRQLNLQLHACKMIFMCNERFYPYMTGYAHHSVMCVGTLTI